MSPTRRSRSSRVTDLGIIRDVAWDDDTLVVTVTPTYSGCPATAIINLDIEKALRAQGIEKLKLKRQLSPPWTTDWISAAGPRQAPRLRHRPADRRHRRRRPADGAASTAWPAATSPIACPRCGSTRTEKVSQFGSTPCKASYRCADCLEPFDYFKCI